MDLFSGIGGFSLGAYRAGIRCDKHYYSEIDGYACKVFQARFPDSIPLGDITKIKGDDLPDGQWIICGGFPCQDISIAGKGAGMDGSMSGLWFEYARLISDIRPVYAIMENVGALTFRGLDRVLGSLAEAGYDAEWCDIRASDVGAPHRRERIWIISYPKSERFKRYRSDTGQSEIPLSGNVCTDIPHAGNNRTIERFGELQVNKQIICSGEDNGARTKVDAFRQWWKAEPAVCELDDGVSNELYGYKGRICNESYKRAPRLKCLGNSIVPQIAELIFSADCFDQWRLGGKVTGLEE